MTRAEVCIPRILKHEGGFVDHPSDPGGATNMGVTIATFRRYVKPNGTVADLKRLTVEQATIVFKRQYWDKVSADLLPVGVDYAVADYAVNSGPARAARHLQEVVGATQDGKVGPQTIAAVKAMDPQEVVNRLCDRRMAFLRGLRTWGTFGKGWSRRVASVRRMAVHDILDANLTAIRRDLDAPPAPSHPDPQEQPTGLLAALVALMRAIFGGKA